VQVAQREHVRIEYEVAPDDALTIRVSLHGCAPLEADGDCVESMADMLEELQRRAFQRGLRMGRSGR